MADTGGTSPGELGGMLAGALALLGAAGAGIRWLTGWVTGREETRAQRNAKWESELDAREREIEARKSADLSRCEDRCAAVEAKMEKLHTATLLLFIEVQHASPHSETLVQVRDLLRDTFPVFFGKPADMTANIDRIDAVTPDTH